MAEKPFFERLFGHLRTINHHKVLVMRHCFRVGLYKQGLQHDLSKYGFTEFWLGVRHFQGDRSPHDGERKEKGYSEAWMHHKGRNKHHFEYWTDYNPVEKRVLPVKMPLRYVAEMFCDRVAASKIYQGENYIDEFPYKYFEGGKGRRFIHQETSNLIEEWLLMLKEKGEDYTLRHIKESIKKDY